jgi:hypothetical protein
MCSVRKVKTVVLNIGEGSWQWLSSYCVDGSKNRVWLFQAEEETLRIFIGTNEGHKKGANFLVPSSHLLINIQEGRRFATSDLLSGLRLLSGQFSRPARL